MKFTCGLLFTILLTLLSSAAVADDALSLHLGVEQWEDGKKNEQRREQWWLQCTGSGPTARCQLTLTKFLDCFVDHTQVSISEKSSEDGSLKVHKLDRATGRLEFSLLYRGGGLFGTAQETSECVLTFNPLYQGIIDRSLLCRMVHRGFEGSVTVIEDRLPRFTSPWKPKCGFWMPGEDRTDDSRLLALLQEALAPDKQQATEIDTCLQKELTPPSEEEELSEGFSPLLQDAMDGKIPITDEIEAQFVQWVKGFSEHFVKTMGQSVKQGVERCLVSPALSPALRKETGEKIQAYFFTKSQATLSKILDALWQEFRALRTKQSLQQGHMHQVQERLKAAGFDPGPIDGALGSQTRTALTQYQSKKGLPVTGMLDQETFKALGLE